MMKITPTGKPRDFLRMTSSIKGIYLKCQPSVPYSLLLVSVETLKNTNSSFLSMPFLHSNTASLAESRRKKKGRTKWK